LGNQSSFYYRILLLLFYSIIGHCFQPLLLLIYQLTLITGVYYKNKHSRCKIWYCFVTIISSECINIAVGALTNRTYSATFTILKFYREGNANGPPRFSLGYGFKSGDTGQFVLHSSNSPDSEPFWVIKKGPLNEYNQYDYAIVSNWVRFPVFVIARDPERFRKEHMRNVLQFLEDNSKSCFLLPLYANHHKSGHR
uniref:Lipocalin domain-containing protein n=1 Tax=Parascaris equorum TaxID=6256 RepID=A0A914REE4_PAREQ